MKDYKEILKGVIDIINTTEKSDVGFTNICTYIGENCPELKENEDERIKKEILNFLKEFERDHYRNLDFSSWIAWLEKQGEQKTTDKVKPKFKVGDWITNDEGHSYLIAFIDDYNNRYLFEIGGYTHEQSNWEYIENADNLYHLWTIDDAKDGDMLVCNSKHGQEIGIVTKYIGKYGGCDSCFDTYCLIDWNGNFKVCEYMGSRDIIPATKEQRDQLFQKMKEAGYEWDDEKKELRKEKNVIVLESITYNLGDSISLWKL